MVLFCLYAVVTAFYAVIFSLYVVLLLLCAVANSLYMVLFPSCTEVKSLYVVPFSFKAFSRYTRCFFHYVRWLFHYSWCFFIIFAGPRSRSIKNKANYAWKSKWRPPLIFLKNSVLVIWLSCSIGIIILQIWSPTSRVPVEIMNLQLQ